MKNLTYFNEFLKEKKGEEFIQISTPIGSADFELFKNVINIGIDSHLEAFIKSKFEKKDDRYYFNFHVSEKPILLRRLQEMADATENENIEMWIEDIKNYKIKKN
jgi:hypothetical protein